MTYDPFAIADLHCDVLCKLLEEPSLNTEKAEHSGGPIGLDVTLDRQLAGNYMLQAYAIYLTESRPKTIGPLLQSVDLFMERIAAHFAYQFVQSGSDLKRSMEHGKLAALLTLEGADGLEGDLTFFRLSIGSASGYWA